MIKNTKPAAHEIKEKKSNFSTMEHPFNYIDDLVDKMRNHPQYTTTHGKILKIFVQNLLEIKNLSLPFFQPKIVEKIIEKEKIIFLPKIEKNTWISVASALPLPGVRVLVFGRKFSQNFIRIDEIIDGSFNIAGVTHWHFFPEINF